MKVVLKSICKNRGKWGLEEQKPSSFCKCSFFDYTFIFPAIGLQIKEVDLSLKKEKILKVTQLLQILSKTLKAVIAFIKQQDFQLYITSHLSIIYTLLYSLNKSLTPRLIPVFFTKYFRVKYDSEAACLLLAPILYIYIYLQCIVAPCLSCWVFKFPTACTVFCIYQLQRPGHGNTNETSASQRTWMVTFLCHMYSFFFSMDLEL